MPDRFLKEIAKLGGSTITYVTWHHYFFDGRKAAVGDFIDPEIFDTMIAETGIYQEIVAKELPNTPMAISETGLVLKGGGELSGSFVACFLWLDVLGVAAAMKQEFVCKQALMGGYNCLVNNDYEPVPLYWVSLMHKQLMGAGVLQVVGGLEMKRTARIYAHCTAQPKHRYVPMYEAGSVTLSVINLRNESITISTNLVDGQKDLYLFHSKNLTSPDFYVNDMWIPVRHVSSPPNFKPKQLGGGEPVVFPPLTCGFVVYSEAKFPLCM